MFLVLHRAGTHGDIGQQVDQVLIVRGVEHLIGGEEAGLLDHAQVHAADGLDTLEQVVAGLRVGIVQQALVAGALGARLVGVDARDDEQALADALLQLGQAGHVVEHGVLAIGRTGADDEYAAAVLAAKDGGNFGVECTLGLDEVGAQGHLLADVLGYGQ